MSDNFVLRIGDCLEVLKELPDNCIDCLVTDPPAGISFMGKEWDDDKGGKAQWIAWLSEVMRECLRVMKPGAHGLVWAIPRTSHWTATALEDAGFEIRDVVIHLFGTGFPKSMDISKAIDKAAPPATGAAKQWQGWGTALKPASEHWILIRKPCSEKTVAANILKWGVGGINIDETRIGNQSEADKASATPQGACTGKQFQTLLGDLSERKKFERPELKGRFPANLVLDDAAAEILDAQSGISSGTTREDNKRKHANNRVYGDGKGWGRLDPGNTYTDHGGASRFFYVAKASKADRGKENIHPTVKSTTLMDYLITLITPPNGIILDPFAGSGSTGVAALKKGFGFLGVEKEPHYAQIAIKRLEHADIISIKKYISPPCD